MSRRYVFISIADFPASPETEQLLSVRTHGDTADAHVRLQPEERLSSDETSPQGDVSSSRSMPRDKSTADVSQIGETSDGSSHVVIRLPSVITDSNQNNDDPPPYTAIPPPYSAIVPSNHFGWSFGIFSLGHSYPTDASSRAEIPLALFQGTPAAPTGFHLEGSDDQHASSFSPLTPYQFFKFGCRGNSVVPRETSFPDNGIAEKIDDSKSRSKLIKSRTLRDFSSGIFFNYLIYYSQVSTIGSMICDLKSLLLSMHIMNVRAEREVLLSSRVENLLSRLSAESVKVSGDLNSKTHAILALNLGVTRKRKFPRLGAKLSAGDLEKSLLKNCRKKSAGLLFSLVYIEIQIDQRTFARKANKKSVFYSISIQIIDE